MSRPKVKIIELTDEEVAYIKSALRKRSTSKTIKDRCHILLDLDTKHGKVLSNKQAAKSIAVCTTTVTNTINKFLKEGLEATLTLKRSANSDNARRKVDGRAEAQLIRIACGPVPEGRARWTLDLLVEESKAVLDVPVTRDTVRRALKKTNCAPTGAATGASRRRRTRNT